MRSIYLGIAVSFLCIFGANAQVVNAPQFGGPGGGPFDDACKPGDVMVGYNVVTGKSMNRFAAVCQAQNNGVLVGKDYGLHTWGQDDTSKPYKSFDTPRCPAGSAISGLQVWINSFHELDSVSATCSPLRRNTGGTSALPRTVANGGKATGSGASTCPNGMIAVGVIGRYGALVDSVGLKCSPFPWH